MLSAGKRTAAVLGSHVCFCFLVLTSKQPITGQRVNVFRRLGELFSQINNSNM